MNKFQSEINGKKPDAAILALENAKKAAAAAEAEASAIQEAAQEADANAAKRKEVKSEDIKVQMTEINVEKPTPAGKLGVDLNAGTSSANEVSSGRGDEATNRTSFQNITANKVYPQLQSLNLILLAECTM